MRRRKKVFIVENDAAAAGRVAAAFLAGGFTVNLATSGADALERMARDVPDIACIKMNLPDIPGEVVILKLRRMAKTSSILNVLYTNDIGSEDEITEKIRSKEGVDHFVIMRSDNDLLEVLTEPA